MGKLSMTRRTFAKLSATCAAATAAIGTFGAGTALAANETSEAEASEIKRIRSCCRGCGKIDRKSTRLNSSHPVQSRMPSSA